jgi:hypothetical protein
MNDELLNYGIFVVVTFPITLVLVSSFLYLRERVILGSKETILRLWQKVVYKAVFITLAFDAIVGAVAFILSKSLNFVIFQGI